MPRATIRRWISCALCSAAAIGARANGEPVFPAASSPLEAQTQAAQGSEADEVAAARAEADRKRRRGDWRGARGDLDELLRDDARDAETRALLARVRFDAGELDLALEAATRALADAKSASADLRRFAGRVLAEIQLAKGLAVPARATLSTAGADPKLDPRDAWLVGRAAASLGDRAAAAESWGIGANSSLDRGWETLLAKARCERKLGFLERASTTLVKALAASKDTEHAEEPDVLVELGSLYFEADGELDLPGARNRSPAPLFDQALKLDDKHEGAEIALYELYRFNWMRQRRNASEILAQLFKDHPRSIEASIVAAAADIDDGQLPSARARLALLEEVAPARREVRTLHATLAWIENDHDGAQKLVAQLVAEDAHDSAPERELGRHLCELYRFAEAAPFLRKAVERDPSDWNAWTELGRAESNCGDETAGLKALLRADETAAGRANAWRNNMRIVLQKLAGQYQTLDQGELSYAWTSTPAPVFRAYYLPFYQRERAELAARYGFTPPPTHIEVFDTWADFSVRSTGFEGFPALGVCFGPVVTAVSPLSEMRGKFSWARTAFHEFSHVIHLGLSHNRCPRWITEGLATWEEENKHRSWTRNMRRELIDSLANDNLLRVRDMNRAFRGPRILFGYYQCGLICRMWIEHNGFASMVRLLEAFDRGADLDRALSEVLHTTPEAVDREFEAFARSLVATMRIEPRWSSATLAHLRLEFVDPPKDPARKPAFAEDLCSLAWGNWQAGSRVDAEQVLNQVDALGVESARAQFLRGEMALDREDGAAAIRSFQRGLELGGDDYRVRMALGKLAAKDDKLDVAEQHFARAEELFPGYDTAPLAAEIALAEVYTKEKRLDDAQRAKERWLGWNDDYELEASLAAWHADAQRFDAASTLYERANDLDPFRRALHLAWAKTLEASSRWEEAAREWLVAPEVPAELDADQPAPMSDREHADCLGHRALCLAKLNRLDEAERAAKEALALDADNPSAKQALLKKP